MRKREQGILTVEASIVLTLMTLFVLFLFSFIRVYRAENMVGHATLQAADGMALESYLRENALDDKAVDVVYLANRLTGASTLSADNFESFRSANVPTIAKEKFIAAVANSETNADTILTNFGVKDGLSGIDFSTSTVDLDHDDVIVNVSYTLKMQFPIFGATELNVTKSAKAKTFGEILFEITAEPEDPNMGSTSGSGNYQHGSTIQITANPNYGYKFVKWNDGNTENPRIVPVTEAQKYIAIFEADSFGITTLVSPAGTGTATGEGTYTYLSTANLSASANPGYHFEKWSVYKHKDSTTAYVTSASTSQTVDQSYTYTANFAPNTYTIKVATSGANGTVTVKSGGSSGKSVNVTYGSTFDLLQTAPTGYVFKGWKVEGGASFISSTNGISVPAKYPNGSLIPNGATITYTAYYETAKFNVTVKSAGNGTATGGGTYTYNNTATIKATPNNGYIFDYWSVNGSKSSSPSSYSFKVTSNVTYEAHFKVCDHHDCTVTEHIFFCRDVHGGGTPRCSVCGYDCRASVGAHDSYKLRHCNVCGKDEKIGESSRWNKHYVYVGVYNAGLPSDRYVYDGVHDDFNTACGGHSTSYYGSCGTSGKRSSPHTWGTYYHIICDFCHAVEQPKQLWWGEIRYIHYCGAVDKNGRHGSMNNGPVSDADCSGFSTK